MKPQIVNIINFIRGVEPRDPALDLLEPVVEQLRLLKQYKLPGTFLIQYDAMLQDRFVHLLKAEQKEQIEIGVWLEIVQPLVEKAGLTWRGRRGFSWDWHSDTGFSVGYTPKEREILIDIVMEDFRQIFGVYPKSVGSWLIDAHSLAYMAEKYNIIASCNCKDQWGTDGYTLWGGYYNQAYYPSRNNVFSPAQTKENQIPVPIFRMLGSDPIYQYDAGMDDENRPAELQPVVTLEPVYAEGGGSPEWVRWYFKENFNDICLSFGYTQVGQENSFGWEAMGRGLADQFAVVAEKAKQGQLQVETLQDSAKWFRETFELTPASAITALSDWKEEGRKSVWYNSRFYRANFYMEQEAFRIRDIQLFDESYPERYLNARCTVKDMIYDNLPVMDGNRWSSDAVRAGIRFVDIRKDGTVEDLTVDNVSVNEYSDTTLMIELSVQPKGTIEILCNEKEIYMRSHYIPQDIQFGLYFQWSGKIPTPVRSIEKNHVKYEFNGQPYSLNAIQGQIAKAEGNPGFVISPDNTILLLGFDPE